MRVRRKERIGRQKRLPHSFTESRRRRGKSGTKKGRGFAGGRWSANPRHRRLAHRPVGQEAWRSRSAQRASETSRRNNAQLRDRADSPGETRREVVRGRRREGSAKLTWSERKVRCDHRRELPPRRIRFQDTSHKRDRVYERPGTDPSRPP